MDINRIISECDDKAVKKLLKDTKLYLDKNNIKLYLDNNYRYLEDNNSAVFQEMDDKGDSSIRCFVNSSNWYWLGNLIHEVIHSEQMLRGDDDYAAFQELAFSPNDIILNKKLPPRKYKTRDIVINLEWKTEKETIKRIKKYNLPVDVDWYSKEAALTLYKYLILFQRGYWPKLIKKDQDKIIEGLENKFPDRDMFCLTKMPQLLRSRLEELRVK